MPKSHAVAFANQQTAVPVEFGWVVTTRERCVSTKATLRLQTVLCWEKWGCANSKNSTRKVKTSGVVERTVLQFLRSVHAAHFEEAEKRKFPGKGRANPFYQKSFVSRTAVVNLLGKRTNNFGGRQCQQLKNKSVID
ncbi:hypothetical protein M514_00033 [Trichuris suis]|uniref:Uncharacterized protein n=1 Tax=Trichuris suis TaxID=68888 RepID=A0A085MNS4_9BILA|nr:hypothetical protein M513_00033 [Trichuris suis]KFD72892.1 hypothetical protein M514_00033 [Trichuris suis]